MVLQEAWLDSIKHGRQFDMHSNTFLETDDVYENAEQPLLQPRAVVGFSRNICALRCTCRWFRDEMTPLLYKDVKVAYNYKFRFRNYLFRRVLKFVRSPHMKYITSLEVGLDFVDGLAVTHFEVLCQALPATYSLKSLELTIFDRADSVHREGRPLNSHKLCSCVQEICRNWHLLPLPASASVLTRLFLIISPEDRSEVIGMFEGKWSQGRAMRCSD